LGIVIGASFAARKAESLMGCPTHNKTGPGRAGHSLFNFSSNKEFHALPENPFSKSPEFHPL
jgi:hypothetical protein